MGIAPTLNHLRTLRYNEYVQHLTQMGLGVFASAGVIGEELPPFEQVGDVLEYLCDDLEEVAQKKGGYAASDARQAQQDLQGSSSKRCV